MITKKKFEVSYAKIGFRKKVYKKNTLDDVFSTIIGLHMVLYPNVISGTISHNANLITFLSLIILLGLVSSIVIKVSIYNNILSKDNGFAYIQSRKFLNSIYFFTGLVFFPYILAFFDNRNTIKFVCISISVILVIIIKNYLFDNIVVFTDNGYYSGSNYLTITSKLKLVQIANKNGILSKKIIRFEIYESSKLIGIDNFSENDFNHLNKWINSYE